MQKNFIDQTKCKMLDKLSLAVNTKFILFLEKLSLVDLDPIVKLLKIATLQKILVHFFKCKKNLPKKKISIKFLIIHQNKAISLLY